MSEPYTDMGVLAPYLGQEIESDFYHLPSTELDATRGMFIIRKGIIRRAIIHSSDRYFGWFGGNTELYNYGVPWGPNWPGRPRPSVTIEQNIADQIEIEGSVFARYPSTLDNINLINYLHRPYGDDYPWLLPYNVGHIINDHIFWGWTANDPRRPTPTYFIGSNYYFELTPGEIFAIAGSDMYGWDIGLAIEASEYRIEVPVADLTTTIFAGIMAATILMGDAIPSAIVASLTGLFGAIGVSGEKQNDKK